jgi:maltose phosphorylase
MAPLLLQYSITTVSQATTPIFLKRIEVLIELHALASKSQLFQRQNQYILGVTGPNEYENNINNNFYTNYIAKWCIDYTYEQIQKVSLEYPSDHKRIIEKVKLADAELRNGKK